MAEYLFVLAKATMSSIILPPRGRMSLLEPPLSIPNSSVKQQRANDSALWARK